MSKTQYLCKGPVVGVYTQDDIDSGLAGQNALGHKKRGVVVSTTRQAGEIKMNEDGSVDLADATKTETLAPCGFDLAALIDAVPHDGLDYNVICPRCDNVVPVRKIAEDSA